MLMAFISELETFHCLVPQRISYWIKGAILSLWPENW